MISVCSTGSSPGFGRDCAEIPPSQCVCVFLQEIFYLTQGKISSQGSFINDSFGVGTAKITRFYHVRVCSLMSDVFTDGETFTNVFSKFNYNKEMKNDSW